MERNRRPRSSHDGCCNLRFLTVIVYFFNFLHFVCSLTLGLLFLWTFYFKWYFVALLPSYRYVQIATFCAILSVLLLGTFLFGYLALNKERPQLTAIYTLLLVIILLVECGTCLMAYSYYEQVALDLKSSLITSLIRDHSLVENISDAFRDLHRLGKCCGVFSFEDWRNSLWWQNVNDVQSGVTRGFDLIVPDFCCQTVINDCGQSDHPSNIYYNGCLSFLIRSVQEGLFVIATTTLAVSFVQLLGACFTTCFYQQMKRLLNVKRMVYNYNNAF
ncbi:hypothetical protein AB6A40_009899 [Gnathostoma spinigerum]|uniref:Tetraspanin n=1 Tax=Gnathostoma spinigerum TaxID=75299 RepID=A0ABD6F2D3_9BILA